MWPATVLEYIDTKRANTYCSQVHQYNGLPNTTFTYEKDLVSVRKELINSAIQKGLRTSVRTRILNLHHYFLLVGHPGERRMRDSLRQKYHLMNMVSEVYRVVKSCIGCTHMGTVFDHQRKLELFQPARPLEFVSIDILGPLTRIKAEN